MDLSHTIFNFRSVGWRRLFPQRLDSSHWGPHWSFKRLTHRPWNAESYPIIHPWLMLPSIVDSFKFHGMRLRLREGDRLWRALPNPSIEGNAVLARPSLLASSTHLQFLFREFIRQVLPGSDTCNPADELQVSGKRACCVLHSFPTSIFHAG